MSTRLWTWLQAHEGGTSSEAARELRVRIGTLRRYLYVWEKRQAVIRVGTKKADRGQPPLKWQAIQFDQPSSDKGRPAERWRAVQADQPRMRGTTV